MFEAYLDAVLAWNKEAAVTAVAAARERGASLQEVYLNLLAPAQIALGDLLQARKISVAQEHFASATTQTIMTSLHQEIGPTARARAAVVIASPRGELHQIGARMFADLLELKGWDADYLGAASAAEVAAAARLRQAGVVGLSVAQTGQLEPVSAMIATLRGQLGLGLRIIVGGRAVALDPEVWSSTGADFTTASLDSAFEWLEAQASDGH